MEKKHIGFLPQVTVMNMLLCLFVVMIHLTFAPVTELLIGSWQHIVIFSLNKLLSFCVPAFLFLSGFKLYKTEELDIKAFYIRRFFKIVLPYLLSVFIYIIYFQNKGWLDGNFFSYIFLGTVSAHFYYVIIAISLYLLFPLLLKLFNAYCVAVISVCAIITVVCSLYLSFGLWDRFFGQYIFYFVLGMLWKKYEPQIKNKPFIMPVFLLYPIIAVFHIRMLYLSSFFGIIYPLSQIVNIFYATMSIIVLYTLSEKLIVVKNGKIIAVSSIVSASSYSVYLYHCLLIYILEYDIFPRFSLTVSHKFIISVILVYAVILLYCALNQKYRKIEKIPK